jgi:hypothetical protein
MKPAPSAPIVAATVAFFGLCVVVYFAAEWILPPAGGRCAKEGFALAKEGGGDVVPARAPADRDFYAFPGELPPLAQGDPATNDARIDPFRDAAAAPDCPANGLTKAGGHVCLDDHLRRMLTTRGGNAASGEAQIGS